MDTDTEITGEQLRVTLNNDDGEIDEAFIAFEADNTADGVLSFTSATTGTNTLEINVEGNTYINTISRNIQVIVENITRELVDGAITLNDGFYFQNYSDAWTRGHMSTFFKNSSISSTISSGVISSMSPRFTSSFISVPS